MNLLPQNQRNKIFDLFGLLADRFLYRGGQQVPEDLVGARERESKEQQKELAESLKGYVKKYNQTYGNDVATANRSPDFYYETLTLDMANLAKTKDQINAFIKALKDAAGDKGTEKLRANQQYKTLTNLAQIIDEFLLLPRRQAEATEGARRGRLFERHELMIKGKEQRELWEKKPAYKELNSVFDSVAGTEAFKGLWQTTEGLSSEKQREAKQLFFAMMAEKTHDFNDTFILGDLFQNDPDKNIENFPFLYNEFLKHEGAGVKDAVSVDKLAVAESNRNERFRNLKEKDPRPLIDRNTDAGISSAELGPEPVMPSTEAWGKRVDVLNGMVKKLEQKAADSPDLPSPGALRQAAEEVKTHHQYAEASLQLSRLKDRENLVRSKFTRLELSQSTRRPLVMKLAMKQFSRAMEMVDKGPFNNSDWQNALHPTVRRTLIASIYDGGVATYRKDVDGKVTYQENVNNPENVWMMAALARSDYFNFKRVGEHLDADHEAVLKAAYLSSRIAVLLDKIEPVRGVIQAWIEIRKEIGDRAPQNDAEKEMVRQAMFLYPPALRDRFAKYTLAELEDRQKKVNDNVKKLWDFLKETKQAINAPYSAESSAFIKKMRDGEYKAKLEDDINYLGMIGIIEGETLDAYERQMTGIQINFKTMELQDQNMLMFFEGLGMNIEGIYPAYLKVIKKDPHLKAEYWDNFLMGTDAEFDKLIKLFETIIPAGAARARGGKEDFITGLRSLRKKYKGNKPLTDIMSELKEGSEDAVVLNVYRMLKIHLTGRAESYAQSDRQQKDIEARMRGMHVGDKVTKYVEGVWDMLTGPGQSMANRAAGFVLLYGMYKSARLAMKGEGKAGKALRALFVAGAVEIAAKEITGRGVLDRLGLDAIAGAMEGTYEAVLLQDAEKRMEAKEITSEAHAAALMELNKVPFNQVMAWYESSDPNGMPRQKGGKDLFPSQINRNMIGPKVTWDVKDKKLEARRVVYQAVRHFFAYVGDKDNHRDHVFGKESLKERWILKVGNPAYKFKYSTYDHSEWIKATGVKKSDINWQMVMRAEISEREVDLTKGKTPVGKLETAVREGLTDISEWVRDYAYDPGSRYVQEFFESMGEGAQDAQAFFAEVVKTGQRKIYFGKEKVILWYGAHQYEIRRVAENHWKLLVTAVKMPFQLVYAVDQWAIPWTLAKLKQVEESLRSDKAHTIDRDLSTVDIARNPLTLVPDPELNPEFTYYGLYQTPFLAAYNNRRPNEKFYYKDPGLNVGYYISEMTEAEAGINPNDPRYAGHPDNAYNQMLIKAKEKARTRFRREGMSFQEIKEYMYPIHEISKTTSPKKLYVFYRMPMQDSMELHLKETGRWADFEDPDKHKDRPWFKVDPSQTSWENLERALKLNIDTPRRVIQGAGGYAALVPRFVFANMEVAGNVIKAIGNAFNAGNEFEAAVDAVTKRSEASRIFIDEVFTSGKNQHLALSEFYKNETNAKLYRFALAYASKRQKKLDLGIMEGRPNYDGMLYLPTDGRQDALNDMSKYYSEAYTAKGQRDQEIERALQDWGRRLAAPPIQAPGAGRRP